jgi:hypothetical protein
MAGQRHLQRKLIARNSGRLTLVGTATERYRKAAEGGTTPDKRCMSREH